MASILPLSPTSTPSYEITHTAPDELKLFIRTRLEEMYNLPPGYIEDGDEDCESVDDPPSKELCDVVEGWMNTLIDEGYIKNNLDLPHITPIRYGLKGLDMFWLKNITVKVYESQTFKDGSSLPGSYMGLCPCRNHHILRGSFDECGIHVFRELLECSKDVPYLYFPF